MFFDKDYDYKTNLLKFQFYYDLNLHEKWDFNLVVQPQLQFIQHQLLNEQFMTPDKPNYLFYREKFTQNKSISLFAFELGFQLRTNLFNSLFLETTLGLGAGYIDVETERLAQGFTFLENFSVGFSYQIDRNEIYLGGNIGHVSNFNIQLPNSGYNTLGFEIGYRYGL